MSAEVLRQRAVRYRRGANRNGLNKKLTLAYPSIKFTMSFKKRASSLLEIQLQRVAATHGFTPKVLSQNGLVFEMENLNAPCLADVYGEAFHELPQWIQDEVRRIVAVLYEREGIEYVDITPYNFIEKNGKLWIIDFGHAYYTEPMNYFLKEFLLGNESTWNPDFK